MGLDKETSALQALRDEASTLDDLTKTIYTAVISDDPKNQASRPEVHPVSPINIKRKLKPAAGT